MCSPAASSREQPAARKDADGRPFGVLSALFGLDDAVPRRANVMCLGAYGKDGIPVLLSHTIDQKSLDKEDFIVVNRSGVELVPNCVTLSPATSRGELRYVSLIGEFGSPADPPVRLRIVGDLFSDGRVGGRLNYRGTQTVIGPFGQGPSLTLAEVVPRESTPDPGRNAGTACPSATRQMVRATWNKVVLLPSGLEVGDAERRLYRVVMRLDDGSRAEVVPFAIADLDDNDNNHMLCLDKTGTALSVSFPAGHLVDLNQDLNLGGEVPVTR